MAKKIAVIAGDGIGKEVTPEAIKVIKAAGLNYEYTDFDLGGERYLKDGFVLDSKTVDELARFDAILLGAIGSPDVKPGLMEHGILLRSRRELDQYVNRRPFKTDKHDFEVVRENTEGSYLNEGGFLKKNTQDEIATQGSINTRKGVERCIRYAFELAQSRVHKHVTLVHKTNVLMFAGDLWKRTFAEVATEYPYVETDYNHIDATCIYMVDNPAKYSVIVTDNLFGDIITDLAGAVSGGIGFAASANLNPDRTTASMFEPVHGSAPDIAGQNKANPIAAIISAAMMCEWLGDKQEAAKIEKAARNCSGELKELSTQEIGDLVASRL
ncbi:3-isopropylmalate dehydrogenase [Candidatus Saccharibacteria bacterium]|jgi:3-isopropylmalate dehydrogenase|nr:3-isopropylmalate dehydrogenase [Candidatus Saccharibacteria bacterium]